MGSYSVYIYSSGKGYFKENNVDVNLTLFHNYGDAINAYSNRDLDSYDEHEIAEIFSKIKHKITDVFHIMKEIKMMGNNILLLLLLTKVI